MSVEGPEQLFREWYAGQSTLTDLLPLSRVVTGTVNDPATPRPYATVNVRRSKGTDTNTSSDYKAELIFEVFADDWQNARDLMDTLRPLLHKRTITGTAVNITRAAFVNDSYLQEPDGVEHFQQTYECRVQ